ncbi:cyclin-dependent kinases regulatory subunit [Pimephales promelas]|nr:cyclin-dependent kinases regulatory subunit [Pimephales promelas]
MAHKQIYYSDKYTDDHYEYRHVVLPRELAKQVPKSHLMSEDEWRRLGVQQSLGWVHYMIHEPVGSRIRRNGDRLKDTEPLRECVCIMDLKHYTPAV